MYIATSGRYQVFMRSGILSSLKSLNSNTAIVAFASQFGTSLSLNHSVAKSVEGRFKTNEIEL